MNKREWYEGLIEKNPEEFTICNIQELKAFAYSFQIQIEEKDKEIDKLTAESTEWESKFYDLQQENERLKTIRFKCLHLIKHNDIYDYRVFEEKLIELLNEV